MGGFLGKIKILALQVNEVLKNKEVV